MSKLRVAPKAAETKAPSEPGPCRCRAASARKAVA
jgi:hypothetical protein